ncbi:unnamed protein product [Trichobilharzia regenti]|nr:unnamed protein product [Trichobilharzia regenti]
MNDIQEVNTPSFMDNDDVILMNNRLMSDLEKIEHFNNKNNIKNSDHSTKKHTEQLLYQVMREKYVRKSKNKINNDSSDIDNSNINNNNDDMHVLYAQESDNINNRESKSSVEIPYKEGTSETLRRILNSAGRNKNDWHSNSQTQLETSLVS